MGMSKAEASAASKARILDGAQSLILKRGYTAMTIDAICQHAGITKGGFFHHFANKEMLGEAVLTQFWKDVEDRNLKATYQQATNPLDYLAGYLDFAIQSYQDPILRQGCMLAVFTMELAESNEALFKIAATHFASWRKDLITILEKVKTYTKSPLEVDQWADFYIATLEGALLLAKANNDPMVITRSLTLYKSILLGCATKSQVD